MPAAYALFHIQRKLFKWKQYITSGQWSKPVRILPRHLFATVRGWCPVLLEQAFGNSDAMSKNMWLDKLEVALVDSVLHGKYKHDIDDLRRVVRMESQKNILENNVFFFPE